ncbi:Zinc finger protein 510 [Papilio xuthus]|uniref:Zinc finger protein 510 n=1 Tax=Papilio xuthus TaxID=66420 RepID=A0A194QMY8_PAPXU|nr:Zinc finger protein 510 [Papilio xuthus]
MKIAIKSYNFIKTTQENSEQLSKIINILSNCSESTKHERDACQTLYISLDPENYTSQLFYDYNQLSKPYLTNAVQRFQSLVNTEETQQNLEFQSEIKIEQDDYFTNIEKINHKHNIRTKNRNHVAIPTSEMLYDKNNRQNLICKGCLKDFPSLSNLRNHYIRVHAPKAFKCSVCHRKFGSQSILEAHKKESHCTLICMECGKTFHNRHTLRMHEMGHDGLKLVCQACGRTYKSHTTFKKHIELNICGQKTRASPAEAKFTCDYCNKKYTQKVSLRVHIQHEHGTYKSHDCKWCKKKFWALSRLNAHIVKHTQEKKFHCNICGGSFVTKESLLYHTRIHTGEKPYKCDLCDKRFISSSRRAEHVKNHHLNATLECDICHRKFKTQLWLDKHKSTHLDKNNGTNLIRQALTNDYEIQILEEDKIYLDVSDCEDYCL